MHNADVCAKVTVCQLDLQEDNSPTSVAEEILPKLDLIHAEAMKNNFRSFRQLVDLMPVEELTRIPPADRALTGETLATWGHTTLLIFVVLLKREQMVKYLVEGAGVPVDGESLWALGQKVSIYCPELDGLRQYLRDY